MKLSEDKCHLLVSYQEEDVYATIESVKGSTSVKLLGVIIDNKLNF